MRKKFAALLSTTYDERVIILRVLGGGMGLLFVLAVALVRIELDLLQRLFVALFGLFMLLTALFAGDKTLQRWFGGL